MSARRFTATAAVVALLGVAACTPADESKPTAAAGCERDKLALVTKGTLTIGTDKPAREPWFSSDDPSNGKGFESAVAHAVGGKLGFDRGDVTWRAVPVNNAIAPGGKKFDFYVNQVSISEEGREAVDFSSGYYEVRQAIIALKTNKIANAKTIADLRGAKLGAGSGFTSLDTITEEVGPSQDPAAFEKDDLARTALKNGQVDGIVVDLPTAFHITAAEVPEAKIVGQFAGSAGQPEQFGAVLGKGSALTSCVSKAVDGLKADGTLAKLEKQWLANAGAPVLQ